MRSINLTLLVGGFLAILSSPLAYSAGAAGAAAKPAASKDASHGRIEEVVVTAERRTETMQHTPIAMSAFNMNQLRNQRIENGQNLAAVIPNMGFQPGNYGRPDFTIRGIGYQIVTVTGEPGVAVHENFAPVTASRIAKADFLDVKRIEVLRGPQGTLYGRNATAGVINIITNKPDLTSFSGDIEGEVGNYNLRKMKGYINVPITHTFGMRLAALTMQRRGYETNIYNNQSVNGRNMDDVRLSLRFKPNDRFTADFMFEGFREHDNSADVAGNGFSVCIPDPGPTSVGGVSLTDGNPADTAIRNYLSFGCMTHNNGNTANLSIYNPAFLKGIPNGIGQLGQRILYVAGAIPGNLYQSNKGVSHKYNVNWPINPWDTDKNDLVQLHLAYQITDSLTLDSLSTYDKDKLTNYGSGAPISNEFFTGTPNFVQVPQILNDHPIGQATTFLYNNLGTREVSEEIRVQSNFAGPVNFTAGGMYDKLNRRDDVFIIDTDIAYFGAVLSHFPIDPNQLGYGAGGGRYYYESLNAYRLISKALFGDVTWNVTDSFTIRAGVRQTKDEKTFYNNSSVDNFLVPGFGITYLPQQRKDYNETTGRLNFEWRPELSFTNSSMFYLDFSRGYKGGGFNPPNLGLATSGYKPEFVNDIEVGTKNTLLNDSMVLDLTLFHYNYQNYQFTRQLKLGTYTSNVNVKITGVELQSQWAPTNNLTFHLNAGFLKTKIESNADATAIDNFNYDQGVPGYFTLKNTNSACIVNTTALAGLITGIKAGVVPTAALFDACGNPALAFLKTGIPVKDQGGVPVSVGGNRLPNVPAWTGDFGVQYYYPLDRGWSLTPRLDYRYTGNQYSDIFNNPYNRIKGYGTFNFTLVANNGNGTSIQFFAQNLGSKGDIIGESTGGTVTGSGRTGLFIDPPTYGVSVKQDF